MGAGASGRPPQAGAATTRYWRGALCEAPAARGRAAQMPCAAHSDVSHVMRGAQPGATRHGSAERGKSQHPALVHPVLPEDHVARAVRARRNTSRPGLDSPSLAPALGLRRRRWQICRLESRFAQGRAGRARNCIKRSELHQTPPSCIRRAWASTPRAAFSHSRLSGSRQSWPVRRRCQSAYARAAAQSINTTGQSSPQPPASPPVSVIMSHQAHDILHQGNTR